MKRSGGKDVEVVLSSRPESAQIYIDGTNRGFIPNKFTTLAKGNHDLRVFAGGYKEKTVTTRALEGWKLIAFFKLAPSGETPTEEPQKTPEPVIKKEEIEILSTPTGFLRVRSEPSTQAAEVGRVKPGEKYTLLEEDSGGWYKIEYLPAKGDEKAKEGWISKQYAKKVTAKASPSPTAKATPTATPKATGTPKPSPTP